MKANFKCIYSLPFLLLMSMPANSSTVLEEYVKRENPCKNLKLITGIAVDKMNNAVIRNFDMNVNGDLITFSLSGSLSCRTSDEAVIKGIIGADFDVNSIINIRDCSVTRESVIMSNTNGRFARAANLLKGYIETLLTKEVSNFLTRNCRDLTNK